MCRFFRPNSVIFAVLWQTVNTSSRPFCKKVREKSSPRQILKHFNVVPTRKILSNVPYQFLYTYFQLNFQSQPIFFLTSQRSLIGQEISHHFLNQ